MAVLNRFFFIWGLSQSVVEGHVRQVVILYHKDCMAWEDLALVLLDKWSSYRGGRLSVFDYICLTVANLTQIKSGIMIDV